MSNVGILRIKRTADIIMVNYTEIMGVCVFNYEHNVPYMTGNMEIKDETSTIIDAWNKNEPFTLKNINFIIALREENGFVAINPDGAVCLICGTGKGVWFVSAFAPMDADKNGILKECIQAAKNIEKSVSVFDI